jgi:hypothetical protein
MKMTSMKTPRTRREFERNFHFFEEQMRRQKMHFNANTIHTMDSLQNVKPLPNKRIDFLTVNESARLHVNTVANFANMPMPDIKEMEEGSSKED